MRHGAARPLVARRPASKQNVYFFRRVHMVS